MRLKRKVPVFSIIFLTVIILGCIIIPFFYNGSAEYMNLSNLSIPPNSKYFFGTDLLGRDIFKLIWSAGRVSLFIGLFSTIISTMIGVLYGGVSGFTDVRYLDKIMLKFLEIIISVPSILIVIFMQGIFKESIIFNNINFVFLNNSVDINFLGNLLNANSLKKISEIVSISIAIGVCNWTSVARIIRVQIKQVKSSEYVLASKALGGNFFHILRKHLIPNTIYPLIFVVITDFVSAIFMESTLSFFGLGLSSNISSWGSMLSQSSEGVFTGYWWIILVPGIFIITTLVSITNIANRIQERKQEGKEGRNKCNIFFSAKNILKN
ncbi:MAG: ABC transporter permease [Clostridioides sp.]|nr:ABC transporter permease [Clostridioides sp.]